MASRFIRKKNTRDIKKRILIVCEGAKTEPNYFKSFVFPPELVVVVDGAGCETIRVIERAIELKNEAEAQNERYDKVWCVFDRDSFPPARFNEAIALAKRNNIEAAYSIEAFEIWYLLHFDYHNAGISRDSYKEKLSRYLGRSYQKNDINMYKYLENKIEVAIKNARKLRAAQEATGSSIYNCNPITRVDLLVEKLREYHKE